MDFEIKMWYFESSLENESEHNISNILGWFYNWSPLDTNISPYFEKFCNILLVNEQVTFYTMGKI